MLEIRELHKAYGKNKALKGISYSFGHGIYALLGPNGSGKSTLMNILTTNLAADAGEVLLDGTDRRRLGTNYLDGLGYMPQFCCLYPSFTVLEMLYYMAELKQIPHAEAVREVDRHLATVELSDVKNQRIRTLSGGMKQRVSLIQALLGNPRVILLDEPAAGLDPRQRIIVRNLISTFALERTIIIATHVVSDIEFTAKEVILLKKGTVMDAGSPAELSHKMRGKVFTVSCGSAELEHYKTNFQVVNIKETETPNTVEVRILSDEPPLPHAAHAEPGLEDRYLFAFGDLL